MPRKPTPAEKQRVRTGCLTCRKRRRKCDEQKPRCANCEVKGFTCKYACVQFVPPASTNALPSRYSSITFIDESPVTHSSNKNKSKQREPTPEGNERVGSTPSVQTTFGDFGPNKELPLPDFGQKLVSYTPAEPRLALSLSWQVLLQSRSNRALQATILAFSAGQRSLISLNHNQDIDGLLRFRKEAEESLSMQPHLELGDSLFWLTLRIDLAASIAVEQAPIMPFSSFVQRDGSPVHSHQNISTTNSVKHAYRHILCLLAHALSLLYGVSDVTPPDLAVQWTYLWTDCQKWYNERPTDTQQIVDFRGSEADQIDPDHNSSFPILIYTTPMALAANVVYHTMSLLLLTHKPRLLKSLPGPRCFTSHIWHAQSIAGIATSNDSPYQWDPIMVSSILLIARDMTHESQQLSLMGRLQKISAVTGINLVDEMRMLQRTWDVARCEELEGEEMI
ncbi:hypothetical protein N7468_005826 [Penicillium chermesinum]|uniref:Zn(2)-C6 fungal-type domain-containing protein n=1 Tax=Penicillium chermesinum TaxID=63820 RepID=A0A9W9TNC2_9EURO|nr:uncharacterized protein N7468_005826 [Penicillium chermesinum]KAJ5232870.1 hypothetical protein N7468_005826 [Penicillium chermesinum]